MVSSTKISSRHQRIMRKLLLHLRRSQCRRIVGTLLTLLLALAAIPAPAHDFWIEPLTFRTTTGATIPLQLLVGQDFKGNAALYNPEQFERYVAVGAGGERPITGTVGDDPGDR